MQQISYRYAYAWVELQVAAWELTLFVKSLDNVKTQVSFSLHAAFVEQSNETPDFEELKQTIVPPARYVVSPFDAACAFPRDEDNVMNGLLHDVDACGLKTPPFERLQHSL